MSAKKVTVPEPAAKRSTAKKTTFGRGKSVEPIPEPVQVDASEGEGTVEAIPPAEEIPAIAPLPEEGAELLVTPIPGESLAPGDERTWAMLAHLSVFLNLVTGFLGPLAAFIIYLAFKERSRYVAYHALQALIFQLIWWVGGGFLAGVAWGISLSLTVVLVGFVLMPLACLLTLLPMAALVYGMVGGVQASQGQDFKYWLVGDWVRRTLTG